MTFALQIISIFFVSFLLCLVVTKVLIFLLPKWGVVDTPCARRMHKITTPRGGGLAILIAFTVGFYLLDLILFQSRYCVDFLVPLWFIGLISFYDDVRYVNIVVRFILQLVVSAYITYMLLLPNLLFHGELSADLDFIIAFITFAGFINIYNFMDGIDGLTVIQSMHLSITILLICILRSDVILHSDLVCVIASITLVCSIVFLRYNWNPAYIFLGDVGSITLGVLMGSALMFVASSGERLFVSTIIASLYYLADGGLTILIRAIRGEKIWLPHLNHFFQQAMKKGMSHRKILTEIILCNFCLMILAVSSLFYPVISLVLAMFVVTRVLLKFSGG